jgi:hypothetical protein
MSTEELPVKAPLEQQSRQALTFVIVCLSVIGVISLCITVIVMDPAEGRLNNAKFVFASALPLLASWVGTILAYYFSKDNFMAATHSVTQLAKAVSGIEKLRSITVKETMRPLREIIVVEAPDSEKDNLKLADLLDQFAQVDRMVLVESKAAPVVKWLIYKSLVHEYISDCARGKSSQAGKAVADLTLGDLVDNAERKELFKTSFGFVSARATLAEVKAVMDSLPQCRDVFVTPNGGANEPIVGWVTDRKVIENSRVE